MAWLRCAPVTQESRKRGRRAVGRTRQFKMPDEDFEALREIGHGNASKGVRELLRFYRARRLTAGVVVSKPVE